MNDATQTMVEEAYQEAAREAISRGMSALTAHKEAVVAAAMLLSAVAGVEDEQAKAEVVALNLRPECLAA